MATKIPHSSTTCKPDSFDALLDEKIDRRIDARAARVGPRWLRCSASGVSHKQRASLPDVPIVKIGKFWFYDAIALDAHAARQIAAMAAEADAANDAADPLADLPPEVASAIRKAAGGARG